MFAKLSPVGRDEFKAAGEKDMKAKYVFEVWASEYNGESEVLFGKERLSIYRTYGPKENEKIEIYAAERVGNK